MQAVLLEFLLCPNERTSKRKRKKTQRQRLSLSLCPSLHLICCTMCHSSIRICMLALLYVVELTTACSCVTKLSSEKIGRCRKKGEEVERTKTRLDLFWLSFCRLIVDVSFQIGLCVCAYSSILLYVTICPNRLHSLFFPTRIHTDIKWWIRRIFYELCIERMSYDSFQLSVIFYLLSSILVCFYRQ